MSLPSLLLPKQPWCWRPLAVLVAFSPLGCAELHHAQISDIDSSFGTLRPVEVHVSELGVSAREAMQVGQALSPAAARGKVGAAGKVIALFQFGPKTGNPVFDEDYADRVARDLLEQCPSGRLTGLVSVRETRKYPVVSGEIVTVRGYCIL